jgi:Cu+-exporting ATPase
MAIDPVCKMTVDEKTALKLEKDGKIYYFCSRGCLDSFAGRKSGAASTMPKDNKPKEKTVINVVGMHCATCAITIEDALKKNSGVSEAKVNFGTEQAFIQYDPGKTELSKLHRIIEEAGYKTVKEDGLFGFEKQNKLREVEIRSLRIKFIVSVILSLPLMYISMADEFSLPLASFISANSALIQLMLATPVLICGSNFFARGILVVFKGRRSNMDTLVSLGVSAAYLYSLFVSVSIWSGKAVYSESKLYYETAAFLITFILLGKFLEARAKAKTSEAIKKLIDLRPKTAKVLRSGKELEIPVEEVIIGDIVIIKPGERISADGIVIEGYSSVDESMVTGESMPVDKSPGKEVIAGTVNKTGQFRFEAIKVGSNTLLAQIIRLVRQAQGSKPAIQELADKISAYFVPFVLVIAVLSFIIWLVFGKALIFALSVAISVLIIACPCALGLATPTAIMVGTGIAAQKGILIKNASSLEIIYQVGVVIFDKTGTITKGRPEMMDIVAYHSRNRDDILQLAASVEKNSEHPLASAVLKAAEESAIKIKEAQDFVAIPGKGVIATVEKELVMLGNRRLLENKNIEIPAKSVSDAERLENEAKTVMFLVLNNKLSGLIAVGDTLKDFAKEAVLALKKLGKKVIMITGDNRKTAQAVAQSAGFDQVLSEVLPQDKAKEIRQLQSEGLKVAMVGDGINDAPALAQADVGIAIGSGTDIAIESGDIVLIKDDLRDVVTAMDLSGYAMKKIRQNLFWAFFYNLIGIPIAAGALYPSTGFLLNPMIAGLAMAFSSVSVVTNSLSMKRYKSKI